jgi:hypothetical protein
MTALYEPQPNTLAWLLDPAAPGVRYLALRDLEGLPHNDPELAAARAAAHHAGPIAAVLSEMHANGYWIEPGPGYLPKYRSTVWSLSLLAQLGAHIEEDERIAAACAYYLEHALFSGGQITSTGGGAGTVDCLQGNMLWALLELGCQDERMDKAFDWMARTVTGEGIAPMSETKAERRYYAGKCGPGFACGANNKLPCAWGAVKVMLAFSALPQERWTPHIERAVQRGAAFLLDGDPLQAGYPNGWAEKPSGNWWKFGFPVFYVTDLLQNVEALVRLGFGRDDRVQAALKYIAGKQDTHGRWAMEYDYSGKTWVDFGPKKQPNTWVTLRALRRLHLAQYKDQESTSGGIQ